MDHKHSTLLNTHRVELVKDMQPDKVVDELIASGILLDHHANEILKKSNAEERNRELLRILKDRGEHAFGKFVEALRKTCQTSLWELLQQRAPAAGYDASSGNDDSFDYRRQLQYLEERQQKQPDQHFEQWQPQALQRLANNRYDQNAQFHAHYTPSLYRDQFDTNTPPPPAHRGRSVIYTPPPAVQGNSFLTNAPPIVRRDRPAVYPPTPPSVPPQAYVRTNRQP
uniref:CARD domain-containing protein n=1 Tax=Plectus sambesii TaxID=2011161 RepID=A0A914VQF7_9BILA